MIALDDIRKYLTSRPKGQPAGASKRIEYIDLAKGICILLVILAHISDFSVPGLVQLRMPLYFMLSGLFFKPYADFSGFAKRKINKLLIPLLFFYVLDYALYYLAGNFEPDILSIFYTRGWLNGPIWFLMCLFWVNVLFYIIVSITSSISWQIALVSIVGILGYLVQDFNQYCMHIDSALGALPFFYFGYLVRRYGLLDLGIKGWWYILLSVALLSVGQILTRLSGDPHIVFAANTYREGDFFLATYAVSLFEVIGLLYLCRFIGWLPVISYMGRYSIVSLGLHMPFYQMLMYLCERYEIVLTDGMAFIATATLCLCATPLMIRLVPHFMAQKNLIPVST